MIDPEKDPNNGQAKQAHPSNVARLLAEKNDAQKEKISSHPDLDPNSARAIGVSALGVTPDGVTPVPSGGAIVRLYGEEHFVSDNNGMGQAPKE